jgi:dolichol kinase
MKRERDLEVRRQMFHLIMGSAIATAVWFLKPIYGNLILLPLFSALALLLVLPKLAPAHPVSKRLLHHFERKKDINTFPYKGAFFYGVGIVFPIVLLPVELACMVILILSIGDAVSTLVGKFHGRIRIGDKSVEGTLAFFVFSFIGSIFFLKLSGNMELAKNALGLSLAGALVEVQDVVDDNLAVPLVLSLILWLAGW